MYIMGRARSPTHLMFANDILLFTKVDQKSFNLEINNNKSAIIFSASSEEQWDSQWEILGYNK